MLLVRVYSDSSGNLLSENRIKKIVKSKHFNLLETLTHSIFDYLMSFDEIKSVKVCVSKPDIYSECEEVGFEVSNILIRS